MAVTFEMIDVPELIGTPGLKWSTADQTASETTLTTVLRGKSDYGMMFDNVLFNALRGQRVGAYGWYAGHTVRHGYGRQFDEVEITAIELIVNYNKGNYYSRFEATARTESRPLEEKLTKIGANDETYLLWWNYQIRGVDTLSALSAGTILSLKEFTSLDYGSVGGGYYWAKSNQALKTGEKVFMDCRFPGVQSYGVGSEQVKEIIYARDEAAVRARIKQAGYLKVPIDSAGIPYDEDRVDPSQWLITSASYSRRLGWFEAQITYAFAEGGWLSRGVTGDNTGVYPEVAS